MVERGAERSFLAECYWPGVDVAQVDALARRLFAASRQSRDTGRYVAFLGSILVPSDETVFCLFHGAEQDVRSLSADVGVPLERLRESVHLDGHADSSAQHPHEHKEDR